MPCGSRNLGTNIENAAHPLKDNILPVEVVFHPNWWHRNYGIHFDWNFFFNPETRVESDRLMRRYLYERFPDLGLGEKNPAPRPNVGGTLLAAGYIISGILGCEIRYFEDAPPEVLPANLTDGQVENLKVPDILDSPIMQDLLRLIEKLHEKFGYLEGDVNWEGVQNVALNLRGQQLFIDYCERPELARKLLDTAANTIIQFLDFIASKTGTTSISVNRIVRLVNRRIHLHSNCTVTMISANHYRQFLLKYDEMFSKRFQPYGIHYCGSDMHRLTQEFAALPDASFFDVGWESDIKRCREDLPDKFLSLRLSPVRMKSELSEAIDSDTVNLLANAGPLEKAGLCCINMDYGTPDENIRTMFEAAERHRSKVAASG